jgi:hypothetical protein
MKVTLHSSQSGRQVSLHLALFNAMDEYDRVHAEVQANPQLTEETADPFLTDIWYRWEQWRATALILAAACVEATINVYLAFKDPDNFEKLQWLPFMAKLTSVPKQFDKNYELPESSELYRDLKRLHERRNALMHLREDVTYQGKTVKGAETGHASMDDEHEFVKRCRNIADRVTEHLRKFDRSEAVIQASMMPGFAEVWSSTIAKFKAAGHAGQVAEPNAESANESRESS